MPDPVFSIVTGRTVHRVISGDRARCVDIVRDAYLAHAHGKSVNPNSVFIRFPDRPNARIIGLPAFLGAPFDVSGLKWIASYPDNIATGLPRASAALLLNRTDTGYPFACLEASIISAARTAASAVLAAEHLVGSRRAASLGVVGCGLIARHVYQFLAGLGWELPRVVLFDKAPAEAQRFAAAVCARDRHGSIEVAGSLGEALACDLVVFATVAGTPYLADPEALRRGQVVLHLSLRDLGVPVVLRSQNIVDDVGHVLNANTSLHLAEQQTGGHDFIAGTLAQVIEGAVAVDRTRPIVFSPFGLGVLDLAVGAWIYGEAERAGDLIAVPDFFYELER